MEIQVGTTIGDYQVVGILGAGGMGKVYKVRNVISDRIEAMKVLLPDLVNAPELADRFLREIKVQATLEHPNIAALHTAVRVDNQLLMLMEFVEGQTIEHMLQNGPLPVADAVNYMSQMLLALDYAHSRGVVHRDIKPANMMLTSGGVIKLMDFGIAKAASDRRLTMTGTTMGSLYYMSPEQIQGASNLDGRADLYSAGVSLYEMVTGKHPFDGDSQFAIMSAHLAGSPIPPVKIDPALPAALNDAILVSVAKDASGRFQTAGAFRNALQSVVAAPTPSGATVRPPTRTATITPPPQGSVTTTPRQGQRGLWMAVGGVAVVVALLVATRFIPGRDPNAAIQSVPANPNMPGQTPGQTPGRGPGGSNPQQPGGGGVPQQPIGSNPQQPQQPAGGDSQQPGGTVLQQPGGGGQQPIQQGGGLVIPQPGQGGKPGKKGGTVAQAPGQAPNPGPPQYPQQNPQLPQQPVQQQPQQQTPQQIPQQTPQAPQGSSQAELQAVREPLGMLNVRANGIRGAVDRIKRDNAAKGYGVNASIEGPLGLMNGFLQAAYDALNAGDAASAKSYMDKADRQAEILERLLNR